MQAIQTRYLSPTNFKGARIKAFCQAGSLTISYPYELSGEACHLEAATKLRVKLKWDTKLIGGQLPNGDYAFVMVNK